MLLNGGGGRCLILVVVLMLTTNTNGNTSHNHYCSNTSCGSDANGGSLIQFQFPFQLIEDNAFCGYPGFALSCTNHTTILHFPSNPSLTGITLSVGNIDYESRQLYASDPRGCLPGLFLRLLHNSSIYPFRFDTSYYQLLEDTKTPKNVTFFDCSSVESRYLTSGHSLYRERQDMFACPVYAAGSEESVVELSLVSCTKVLEIVSLVRAEDLRRNTLRLTWSKPKCDDHNFYCNHKPSKTTILLPTTGSIVLVLLLIAFFKIYRFFKMKGDDQARLENFLEDYTALRPTRFSYSDLRRITNHFKDKLGEGAHGAVFKGKLSTHIPVAIKVLNNSDQEDGRDFINEVGTMGTIHHINVVRLLGFCADGFHRALVYDFYPNGSLQNFLSSPDDKENFLGWSKLHQIALGVAKGIEYLHQGCDHRILHFDINPRNVLLDHNLAPKITDFGLAKLCSKNQSTVSMTAARGTLGYIAPEVFSRNFGNVSYKSDIYSYGMLLLEMVGGRKNTSATQDTFQVLYPEWIHNLIEGRDININIEDEDDIKIAKKLAIVGLWCIQWHPMNRPSIIRVLQMLEGEEDKLKVPPNHFDSNASTSTSVNIPTRRMNLELEVIRELE
ncbi:rust resistance kinase Lr10-like [Senna tora]|uniref:Rust resistance kinase Lr10-like n=1 Tax=Senna tora TaxID=362788 RepID=A0A834SMG3_9FABA|nr:rust resistance kinase Lr10-like [Senna tora]